MFFDVPSALLAVYTVDFVKGLNRLVHVVDQEAGLAIRDDLSAGAQVHRDYGHAGCIRLGQHQAKPFGDGIEVKNCLSFFEKGITLDRINRADILNRRVVDVGLEEIIEVILVLNYACYY